MNFGRQREMKKGNYNSETNLLHIPRRDLRKPKGFISHPHSRKASNNFSPSSGGRSESTIYFQKTSNY